ncbi:hypothetical protein [Piscinibacter sp. XHJ-5]|uniref:glycine-rich domain-containing protein n=1 Tax=Piscinibacter sp. XHJ-5 TaxID=3037797 RepID=UPI00245283B5|nr:hypothetical protein [Piscinibacter sp. XHJ-5]
MTPFFIAACVALSIVCALLWQRQVTLRRDAFIRNYSLPHGLFEKLRRRHPQLTLKECQLVSHGLRQFFLAHLKSGRQYVSMPSQVADDLWHEFILYTKNYQAFCERAFGRFFHHTPAAVLSGGQRRSNEGLRRCWWHVCREENIDPRAPTRLPLLFALDAKLNIANGFRYAADCEALRRQGLADGAVHCGGDFSSSSVDGGTDGLGDGGDAGGGDGSGCGGGCGGGD